MAKIRVTATGGESYRVEVAEGGSRTSHEVTARVADVKRYGGATPAERLIEESFEFLLEREPKESILGRFDLPVIERYFPEYPREIGKRLAGPSER